MNSSGRSLQLSHLCIRASLWIIGTLILTALLVYQLLLLPIIEKQGMLVEQEIAKELVITLSKQVTTSQFTLQQFAKNPHVISALEKPNPGDLTTIKDQLQQLLPLASHVTVKPATEISDPELLAKPTLQIIGAATKSMEITAPVTNHDKALGLLSVQFDNYALLKIINSFGLENQYGELREKSSSNSNEHVMASNGKKIVNGHQPDIILPIESTPWELAIWFNTIDSPLAKQLALSLIVIVGLLLLINLVLLKISYHRLRKALYADLNSLDQLLADQPVTILQLPAFKLHAFNTWLRNFMQRPVPHATINQLPASTPGNPAPTANTLVSEVTEPLQDSAAQSTQLLHETIATISADIFRAYDIRGIVGETLTPQIVYVIGAAIGAEAQEQGISEIVIARDGRLSGPVLSEALCQGLLSTGTDVIDVGAVPTPVLYFAAAQSSSQSGIMLTGSHNPTNYNGLKIVLNGKTLANNDITKIYQRIVNNDFANGEGTYRSAFIVDDYIQAIVSDITITKPLRVVIDAGNGITGIIGVQLFEELGCKVIPLYCEIDGNFPNHHPDPSVPENLQDLIATVKEEEADLGIAFDGDGDRLGIVTNTGEIIWPDRQMMLFANDVLSRNPDATIIFDVKCTRHLAENITQHGGKPLMWKTGHSLVKAKMRETGALLAGEMSGHIFFKERWLGFDDALYSGARLLEILSQDKEQRTLQEIFDAYPDSANTPEIKIEIAEDKKFDFINQFISYAIFKDAKITTIDGLRADFVDGFGLVRPSNTTPCLVLRFEGDNENSLQRIQLSFKKQLLKIDPSLQVPF